MTKQIKTMKDVREKLIEVINKLEARTIDLKDAAEINNGIGKVINTVRTQLEYSKLRKEKPVIGFMKCQ